MRNALFILAGSASIFAVLRLIQDGPAGEIVGGIAVLCACVLFGCGAIVDAVRKQ